MTNFTHNDYTVAWICALPLEMAAAKAMLDELHTPLPQPPTDHNAYTLGTISGHNVAIACLPSGVYGTTSAAIVMAQVLSTFPSLRFGLMVGIGGGVPSQGVDIRLGDVVVSKPTATSGGVIQYDYGKTVCDGQFRRVGSLNKPPQILLSAAAQMESDAMLGNKKPIRQIIADTLETHSEMRDKFLPPDEDVLFCAEYNHQNHNDGCSACDRNHLVDRTPRASDEPYVHYGLIASGNQVMKDAKMRDRISQELGIICFEMEAAGLMDQLPCLVVRGICDYCDSHKLKQWQGYAALTAAAYTRMLLAFVAVNNSKNDNDLTGHKGVRDPCWMVPFGRNPRFVGRQGEISKLDDLVFQQGGPRKTAITGLGGIGKTQVALELAYRIKQRDPDCSIFWIPSTSYESIEQAYVGILMMQGLNPADVQAQIKSHFSRRDTGKWLFIFDNADDEEMWTKGNSKIAPALKNLLPDSDQGHIIFTTRNRKLAVKLASSNVISIQEPDNETAMMMLQGSLIQKDLLHDNNATAALLYQLAFLPLAIIQAAAYINENNIDLAEYFSLLKEQETEVVDLLSENFEDDGRYTEIQNPVATTWLISFHQIQQLSPLAADYLSFMSCIDPQNIPESLLPPAPSQKKKIDALGYLKAYSFISTAKTSLNLHRLVHLATRNWLRTNGQLSSWTQKTADRLNEVFPNNDHTNRQLWRQYLPHVLYLVASDEFQKQKKHYTELLWRVGDALYSDGRYNESEPFFSDVMRMQKNANGDKHLSTLASMESMASTYRGQGRWEKAERLQEEIMEARKQILGLEHPDTITSMGNLASTYRERCRWREAEILNAHVLEMRKQILGPDHPDTLTSMASLASTYRDEGHWTKAEELGKQVLEAQRSILGLEHPDTLASMGNLASIYRNQRRWKEAEELRAQHLELCSKILGAEHPDTLTSMANLASTYWNQGRWKEAEKLQAEELKLCVKTLGPEHPETLTSMNNLAQTCKSLGKDEEALGLMMKCVRLRREQLGPVHPHTLFSAALLTSWQKSDTSIPMSSLGGF